MGITKKKTLINTTIKGIRNLFSLQKENELIKDRILRDISNVFKLEKENKVINDKKIKNILENEEEQDYYNPVRASNFWSITSTHPPISFIHRT